MINLKEIINSTFNFQQYDDYSIAKWSVPSDLKYFEGHFPNNPVLPGICCIDISLESVRFIEKNRNISISKVKSAKFLGVISPEDQLELKITKVNNQEWNITWSKDSKKLCEIIINIV